MFVLYTVYRFYNYSYVDVLQEISFTISSPQEARTAKVGSFQVNKEQNGHWKVMYATREIEYYPTHLIDITSSTNTSWTESDRSYEYTVSSFGEELLVALPAEP